MNYRQIQIWNRLGTPSRRAIRKTKKSYGNPYFYNPRGDLLQNVAREFNISLEEAYDDLQAIRKHFLTYHNPHV